MKKVLFIITKSNFGGAQRYVFDLATNVPNDRYEAIVALGGTGGKGASVGSLDGQLREAGVRTVEIKHFMRDVSLLEDVRAFFELIRILRTLRPDILHVTSSKAGGLGALAGRCVGIQTIIFTSHGLTFDETWRPWWQRMCIKAFTWGTIMLSTVTIQISRDTYARAAALPFCRSRVRLVYNGISEIDLLPRDIARARLAPGDGGVGKLPWIGTIAEYHPNKNLGVLVRALAVLHRGGLRPHLFLIGDGDLREALAQEAEACGVAAYVHLTGYVEGAARYLKALDAFALPSRKEGLPYVLLEAGYAGVPSVVSPIPGNTDIIEHGVSGLVAEADDAAFARALSTLVCDATARTYGDALRERVLRTFSITRMVSDTIALYEETSSNPATSRSRS